MQDQRGEEKRKYPRKTVRCTVQCLLSAESAPDLELGPVTARDLSLGGMFLECAHPPTFGTKLTLRLNAGSPGELHLPAVVRWNTDNGFGVQFGLLGARDTHAVLTLLKKTAQ